MRTIAGTLDLEMPGALPEIIPSPEYDPFVDFRDRAMFMQAWSSYGTQWPVIHSMLGIDPDVPARRLVVVPHVPGGWPGLSVRDLRIGADVLDAAASHDGDRYVTRVDAPRGLALTIGHVLPGDARPASVRLDGKPVAYELVATSRGAEVRVEAQGGGHHELVLRSD
jgi:hypothetical protein